MINDCIYRTEDSGCRRLYVFCPLYFKDVTELGCGGVCIECEIEEENSDEEERDKSE